MFLLGCGLDRVLASQAEGQEDGGLALNAEARQLTMPGMMGERFQVMGLCRGLGRNPDRDPDRDSADSENPPLSGFSLQDLRYRL
jgi:SAM-dependent MidA family methyltransferase